MTDRFRPFHWPDSKNPVLLVEPLDENCPQAWDVYELDTDYSKIGQVVRHEDGFQAWGRVWDTSLGTLVPLWFRGPQDVAENPNTDTIEGAVARIYKSWQQFTD